MSVYEDRKQALEEYEFRMGLERGRLAVTMDLLTDARHWCDLNGQSFGELDRRAHQHYLAEIHETKRSNP